LTIDQLQLLDPVDSARYDYDLESSSTLHPGTRESLLNSILEWSKNDAATPYFWLSGLAGTGKTTIARSICGSLAESGLLVASFFFSRSQAERSVNSRVIPTLTYQLASVRSELLNVISEALQHNPDAARRTPQLQCRSLITSAFRAISGVLPPIIVVLDAMDECDDEGGELLPLLVAAFDSLDFQVKLLITSRPTATIRPRLQPSLAKRPFMHSCALHELSRSTVDEDIRAYLRHRLSMLVSTGPDSTLWPSDAAVEELVRRTGGLFIYAATVVEFVADKYEDPKAQLARLLSTERDEIGSDFGRLDSLYRQILQMFLPKDGRQGEQMKLAHRFRLILGAILVLQTPLTIPDLSALLDLNVTQTWKTLSHLRAVLIVPLSPNRTDTVRVFHESFVDYLLDPERCVNAEFLIKAPEHHGCLATLCLHLMIEFLRRDMRYVGNLVRYNVEVPGIAQVLDNSIPPHLLYACMHWATHLSRAPPDSPGLMNVLNSFVTSKIVVWIETLSLLGKLQVAIPSLLLAKKWSSVRLGQL
jgi:hypothetical protein